MNKDTLLEVQAYLDNELSPGEARKIAEAISRDPETRAIYNELKDTKEILTTTGEVPLRVQDTRDFYWSQVQRRITAEEKTAPTRRAPSWWLRLAAPLAGAVALFAVLLSIVNPPDQQVATNSPASVGPSMQVEHTAPGVSTVTFRSEMDGLTVVWVSTE